MLHRTHKLPLFSHPWEQAGSDTEHSSVGSKLSINSEASSPGTNLPVNSSRTSSTSPQPIDEVDARKLIQLSDPQAQRRPATKASPRYKAGLSSQSSFLHYPPVADVAATAHLKQQLDWQQRLRQVEQALRKTLDPSTVFGTTVVESAELLGAQQVVLLQRQQPKSSDAAVSDAAQSWRQVARYCQNQAIAWQEPFVPSASEFPNLFCHLQQGKALTVANTDTSVVTAAEAQDTLSLVSAQREEACQWLAHWPGTWLLVPIQTEPPTALTTRLGTPPLELSAVTERPFSTHWGVLAIALPEGRSWLPMEVLAAHSISVELAVAIAHSQQYQALVSANQALQSLALSDGLTDLANRRRFDEHLLDEWHRLAREQQPLSLILCDLDHFKLFNDTFGHPAGDRCLIKVARALLKGPQRSADLVARYGGEEFAVILPNTDTHGAWRIAQKIHDNVRELKIAHAPGSEEPYVTVTMGVSTVIPSHDNTAQMLVQAADLALYHAKQQGRNRIYVHAHYNTITAEEVAAGQAQPDITPPDDTSPNPEL